MENNASNALKKELNKVNENKLKGMPEQERINYLITFSINKHGIAFLCNIKKQQQQI